MSTGNPIAKREWIKRNDKCSIPYCENEHKGRGYCKKHYARFNRHGKIKLSNTDISPIAKLIGSISLNEDSGCLEWNKSISLKQRYPYITVNKKRLKAHRFSYEYFIGEIPKGLFVLHKCDNTKCCNPDHLFLGTQADNVADMVKKGRNRY